MAKAIVINEPEIKLILTPAEAVYLMHLTQNYISLHADAKENSKDMDARQDIFLALKNTLESYRL